MDETDVRADRYKHSCLSGNFAPVQTQRKLEPCKYTGKIPIELHGGQYIRNGGNPSSDDLSGDIHMFDGDGMLSGVFFRKTPSTVEPCFVNRYILTDVFLAGKSVSVRGPILPSISTLVNPFNSVISVANTAVLYHDRRALATCQTGPPMRVQLPGLETVGWYNGISAENENDRTEFETDRFGRCGLLGFLKDWTTAHPRVDQITGELISFQSSFMPPFVWYSVIPKMGELACASHAPVPGISSPKFMHDFGVSPNHTVILDLPVSLDAFNLIKRRPIIHYDASSPSRFGVFARNDPVMVRWFETEACFIFHTAATWDEMSSSLQGDKIESVNMIACRYSNANMLYSMGGIYGSLDSHLLENGSDSRLYYYRFLLSEVHKNTITHQWALSSIPFEMPISCSHKTPTFIYGCSSTDAMFGAKSGECMKIDCLVKANVQVLIKRGMQQEPQPVVGCVDNRSVTEILASNDPEDPIQIFQAPQGWYAQEPQFIPRHNSKGDDDGYLLTLMFDESQIQDGVCSNDSKSELWVIDSRDMRTVVARICLPQRVPYGFHGNWFTERQISEQRAYISTRTKQWNVLVGQTKKL